MDPGETQLHDNRRSYDIWSGLNRLAFHEALILLDVKGRCQGPTISSPTRRSSFPLEVPQWGLKSQIEDVLDDIALVAAGEGGKDAVTAACMEKISSRKLWVVRLARNEAQGKEVATDLTRLFSKISTVDKEDLSSLRDVEEKVLAHVFLQCQQRIQKHWDCLANELRGLKLPPVGFEKSPATGKHIETVGKAAADTAHERCSDSTHASCKSLACEQLQRIRSHCDGNHVHSNGATDSEMVKLSLVAYDTRRSTAFHSLLLHNTQASKRLRAREKLVEGVIERLGKLARFWRAAMTLTMFGLYLLQEHICVRFEVLSITRLPVRELQERTALELKDRGGWPFSATPTTRLSSMLSRWKSYRIHAEMQLLVYYEEHQNVPMVSHYIGCDKLCCYLCYAIVKAHGKFIPNGCHQAIYSLWTLPQMVNTVQCDRKLPLASALQALHNDVIGKLAATRTSNLKYPTNNESFAHISRPSLLDLQEVQTGESQLPSIKEAVHSDHSQESTRVGAATEDFIFLSGHKTSESTEFGLESTCPSSADKGEDDVLSMPSNREESSEQRTTERPEARSHRKRQGMRRRRRQQKQHIQRRQNKTHRKASILAKFAHVLNTWILLRICRASVCHE